MDERYISIAEMCADLAVSDSTIRRALNRGHLRGMYLGTQAGWRVTREDFAAWKETLYKQKRPPKEPKP